MSIFEAFCKIAIAFILGLPMTVNAAEELYPSLDADLNNFDPTVPIGRYIQKVSSNEVVRAVMLTNGVLTVGGESINVAEPTHSVVVTNIVDGQVVITTNKYDAVYEDSLNQTLAAYAKLKKVTSITTNVVSGVVTTNWTEVAYKDDIPSDSQKADKVIQVWDYAIQGYDVLLPRKLDKDAPFAAWGFDGEVNGFRDVLLIHTNDLWSIKYDGTTTDQVEGAIDASQIVFPNVGLTLVKVNDDRFAYVVYTDILESEMDKRLSDVVTLTNLYNIAGRIEEEKLVTIGGIQEILRGIRSEINAMAGGKGIRLAFRDVSNSTLVLDGADMRIPGDTVEIDWGDGSENQTTTLPASHTYAEGVDNVTVTISGFIREISGSSTRAENGALPFARFTDNDNSRLVSIKIDPIVGIESLGYAAFYQCSGLSGDLNFLPNTITNIGERCFEGSGINSLVGWPDEITKLPPHCFSRCSRISNLSGLSQSVVEVGDSTFEGCEQLLTLQGMPQSIKALGTATFRNCGNLSDIAAIKQTSITNIPAACFEKCGISSIGEQLSKIQSIGTSAFAYNNIESATGFQDAIAIGEFAFASNQIVSVSLYNSSIHRIPNSCFVGNEETIAEIVCPQELAEVASNAFSGVGINNNCIIYIQQDIKTIEQSSAYSFPAGAGEHTTFVGIDGQIYKSDGDEWEDVSERTEFTLEGMPQGSHTVTFGEIVETPTPATRDTTNNKLKGRPFPRVMIDWGSGNINTNKSHTYTFTTTGQNLTKISILGKIDSIAGFDDKPFIAINNSQTNRYLQLISLGSGVEIKSFGPRTFLNCGLTGSRTLRFQGIGASLETIGEECFRGAYLTNMLSLANSSISSLPDGCFRNSHLTSLLGMPHSITTIGDDCFKECLSLNKIDDISPNIESMGLSAFEGCVNLASDSAEKLANTKVVELPQKCFKGCLELTSFTNGVSTITSIGAEAFSECTKIADVTINKGVIIGKDAFYQIGSDINIPTRKTEDNISYKVAIAAPEMNFKEAADALGLENQTISSGLPPADTIVYCTNQTALVWNNAPSQRRWEVLVDALNIALDNVPNGTQFQVQPQGAKSIEGAMLLWNWGDGSNSGWVDGVPPSHTYSNGGSSNYLVKVKGLLSSISSAATIGPFVRPVGNDTNPYLTGFEVPVGSTLKTIGDYSFQMCPNLKTINTIESPRNLKRKWRKEPSRRDATERNLNSLYDALRAANGDIEFGEYCFAGSGIRSLANFPPKSTYLPIGLFSQCGDLTSLQGVGNDIVDMGDFCYAGTTSLTSLVGFPTTLTYISNYGFAWDSSLNSLSALLSTDISYLGDYSFYQCTGLSSLQGLPSSLKKLGMGVFQGTALQTIEGLPTDITDLGTYTFAYCDVLSGASSWPSGIKEIGDGMFFQCQSLQTLGTIPTNITRIGKSSFAHCGNLTSGVFHKGITNIEDNALLSVGASVPPTYDDVGILASTRFMATDFLCSELIDILSAHTNNNPFIEFECYDGFVVNRDDKWEALYKTIEFELENVKANSVFSLGQLDLATENSPIVDWGDGTRESYLKGISHKYLVSGNYKITVIGYVSSMTCTAASYPILYSNTGGNPNLVAISVGAASLLSTIGDYCFKGCSNLRSITGLSNSKIGTFGRECFKGCTALASLTGMPLSLYEMGTSCFEGCSSLTSMEGLWGTCSILPSNCFANCTGITTISNMPSFVKGLAHRCFAGCSNLVNLVGLDNGERILSLDTYVFQDCTGLTNLYGYSTNYFYFAEGLFSGCTGLVSLEGPSNEIDSIPSECFKGCTSLTNLVSLPRGVRAIGDGAFQNCSGLTTLIGLPEELESIGVSAFSGCSLLRLDGFPRGVIRTGEYAFANNEGLGNIDSYLAATNIDAIAEGSFFGCSGLGLVDGLIEFPLHIKTIGAKAFEGCGLKSPMDVPSSIETVKDRAFASSYLPSITMHNSNLDNIGSAIFAEEKDKTEKDESYYPIPNQSVIHTPITRRIAFPENSIADILSSTNFPWGASITTEIVGSDGFLLNHEGSWVKVLKAMEIDINVETTSSLPQYQNVAVAVENIMSADTHGICIDWGNGNYTNWIADGLPVTNIYTAGEYKITIWREISSIGHSSNLTANKVVRKISSWGQLYITSVLVTENCGCQEVGVNAFNQETRLQEMPLLPQTVTNIGYHAFAGCSSLSAITNLPPSIEHLSVGSFQKCSVLKDVKLTLPSIDRLPAYLFYNCSSMTNLVADLPILSSLGDEVMEQCTQLQSLDLQATSVTNIGKRAFSQCERMRTLILPPTIEFIATNAFLNIGTALSSLVDSDGFSIKTTISIGKTMESVIEDCNGDVSKANGMWGAPTTTKFACLDGDIVWDRTRWILNPGRNHIMLTNVPANTTFHVASFQADAPGVEWDWGDGTIVANCTTTTDIGSHTYTTAGNFNIRIKGKIKELAGISNNVPFVYSTNGNPYITSVFVSNANTTFNIGPYAFANCITLSTINIGASYGSIGTNAFFGCELLKDIIISTNCVAIEKGAFANCSIMEKMTIPGTNWPTFASNSMPTQGVQIVCEEILSTNVFPIVRDGNAINTNSTVCTFDDDIVYENNKWVLKSKVVSITGIMPTIRSINIVTPTLLPPSSNNIVIVDWGDGRRDTYKIESAEKLYKWMNGKFYSASTIRHNYQQHKEYTIKIKGKIKILNGIRRRLYGGGLLSYSYAPFIYTGPVRGPIEFLEPLEEVNEIKIGERVGVTTIGAGCFSWMPSIRANNLILPETINEIQPSAFVQSGIDNLSCLPRGITKLPDHCFMGCKNLTSLDNIPTNISQIGVYCFGNDPYKHIEIDNTPINDLTPLSNLPLTTISEGCFRQANLQSLLGLPATIRTLGKRSFEGCSITNFVGLPQGVEIIPEKCFFNNKINSFLGMPDSVTTLEKESISPFYGKDFTWMPNSISSIGYVAPTIYDSPRTWAISNLSAITNSPNLESLRGLSTGISLLPIYFCSNPKGETFIMPTNIKSSAFQTFKGGTKLIFTNGVTAEFWTKFPYAKVDLLSNYLYRPDRYWYEQWILYGYENGHVKRYLNCGQWHGVQMQGYATMSCFTEQSWSPIIKAKLDITEDNTIINVGSMELYTKETPMIVDWGDGTVEYLIGYVPTNHTYTTRGTYDIHITTEAISIGGYNGGPFLAVGDTGTNPYLKEFSFADSMGIIDIGSTSFINCPNLEFIQCTVDVGEENWYGLPGLINTVEYIPIKNSDKTSTEGLKQWHGYPWGFEGSPENIIGTDGVSPSEGDYIQFAITIPLNGPGVFSYRGGSYLDTITINLPDASDDFYSNAIVNWGDQDDQYQYDEFREQLKNPTIEKIGSRRVLSHHFHYTTGDKHPSHSRSYTITITGVRGNIKRVTSRLISGANESRDDRPLTATRFRSIKFGPSITVSEIAPGAFKDATALSIFDMNSAAITKIGDQAFMNTRIPLDEFPVFPSTLQEIGSKAFWTAEMGFGVRGLVFNSLPRNMTIARDAFNYVRANSMKVYHNSNYVNRISFPYATDISEIQSLDGFPFGEMESPDRKKTWEYRRLDKHNGTRVHFKGRYQTLDGDWYQSPWNIGDPQPPLPELKWTIIDNQ